MGNLQYKTNKTKIFFLFHVIMYFNIYKWKFKKLFEAASACQALKS